MISRVKSNKCFNLLSVLLLSSSLVFASPAFSQNKDNSSKESREPDGCAIVLAGFFALGIIGVGAIMSAYEDETKEREKKRIKDFESIQTVGLKELLEGIRKPRDNRSVDDSNYSQLREFIFRNIDSLVEGDFQAILSSARFLLDDFHSVVEAPKKDDEKGGVRIQIGGKSVRSQELSLSLRLIDILDTILRNQTATNDSMATSVLNELSSVFYSKHDNFFNRWHFHSLEVREAASKVILNWLQHDEKASRSYFTGEISISLQSYQAFYQSSLETDFPSVEDSPMRIGPQQRALQTFIEENK